MTLAQKIKAWIDDFVKNIKKAFEGVSAKSQEAVLLEQILGDMTELQKMWDEALEDALRTSKAKGTVDNTRSNSNLKHSFRNSQTGTAHDKLLPYSEELTSLIENSGNYIINSFDKLKSFVDMAFDNPKVKAVGYFGIIDTDTLAKIEKSVPNIPKELNGTLFKNNKDYSIAVTLDSIRHLVDEKKLMTREDVIDYLDRLADTVVDFDNVAFDYYTNPSGGRNNGLLFKKTFEDGTLVSFNIISNKKRSLNLITVYLESGDYKKRKSAETLLMQNAPAHTLKAGVGQTSIDSVSPSTEKVNKIQKSDRVYLDAVEAGDMETAQRMVDEAAEQSMPDSIIRDESGKLLTVYHGSPGKFTVFSHNKMNTNGNAHGRGFYFTEEKSMAEGYKKDGGQLLKGYLNITNPMSEEKVTIKKSDLLKYIKATCIQEAKDLVADGSYDTVNEALPDTWISNYVYTYGMNINDAYREVVDIIYNNDNDVDIIAEISNVVGTEIALKKAHEVLGYDGVIYTNDRGTHEYVSLISNQFKSAETTTYDDNGDIIPLSKRFDQDNADVRFSKRNYSYDALVSKPDMKVTVVDDTKKYEPSKETRNHITNEAIKNAASVGHTNENGNAVVYVKDIDTDVVVSKTSIRHGLDRRLSENAPASLKVGEILQNAIRINEMTPQIKTADKSYVLIGVAKNKSGELSVVRLVVNSFSNELESIDNLYALNTKKESAVLNAPTPTNNSLRITDSEISISDLLDYVNKYFPDILPEDVLKHYGHTERPDGSLSKDILFSRRSTQADGEVQTDDRSNFTHRELLRNALSTVAQNDTERDFLARYQREIKDVEKKYEEVDYIFKITEKSKMITNQKIKALKPLIYKVSRLL